MADTDIITRAPAAHGPVTAAIRAFTLDHDPNRAVAIARSPAEAGVISLAAARTPRPPIFTPLEFSFPLSDEMWSAAYLPSVRFAVDFTNLRGREAVERVALTRELPGISVPETIAQMGRAIDHLEELAELVRTARSRLIQVDAHAASATRGRAAR